MTRKAITHRRRGPGEGPGPGKLGLVWGGGVGEELFPETNIGIIAIERSTVYYYIKC
jgi:hypothetical protein